LHSISPDLALTLGLTTKGAFAGSAAESAKAKLNSATSPNSDRQAVHLLAGQHVLKISERLPKDAALVQGAQQQAR